jgi:uncharacterized protein (TIGR03437 family)
MVTLSYGSAYPATQIPVTLNLSGSLVTLSAPASLSFIYAIGGPTPASQMLNVGAGSSTTVNAAVTSGSSWLSVSPASITAPGSFTVSVNTAGLPLGMLNGNIQLTATGATNSPLSVPVSLNVTAATLTASPLQLNFAYQVGNSAQPTTQSITVTDLSNVNFTATAATASGGSWLSVSPGTGSASGSLSVSVKTAGLTASTYNGTVTIAVAGVNPNITPQVVNVSLVVSAASGPTISTVVSGASYATSGFSPGTIATIFGNLLGPATGVAFSLNSHGSLDSTLAGVSVTVGSAAAIPLYVLNGQVNIILPFTLGTSGQAPVQVTYNNLTTAAFNIPLTTADVQIFTANASGSGPGSILNQDYSINSATNPAAPGTVVQVFGTGGGALTGAGVNVAAGDVAGDTLADTATCTATVNGETAAVLYSGSAPGLVYGVDQFNIQLPADVTAGSTKIVLTIGGTTSQSDVTVFVK